MVTKVLKMTNRPCGHEGVASGLNVYFSSGLSMGFPGTSPMGVASESEMERSDGK